MIPKSSKDLPEALVDQINSTLTKSEEVIIEEPKKNYRQVQINFALPEEVKTNWKILCDKNHINLKQGITFAMEHLIQEIENNEFILTIGGVMKKRK